MGSMFNSRDRGPVTPMSSKEAIDRHIALVQSDGLGRRFNKPSVKHVYHYTSLMGLRGIINSKALWASDYRYLNDRTEFAFGLDILEICVAHQDSTPTLSEALRRDVLHEIAMMKRSHSSTYVLSVSFCEKGNVLSQWRAYGRQDGVAMGFDRTHLAKCAAAQGFVHGPVQYYWSNPPDRGPEDRFSAWLARQCDSLASTLDNSVPVQVVREVTDPFDDAEREQINATARRLTTLRRWIADTAAFIKHPGFEEELEWRCVLIIDNEGVKSSAQIKDRPSGSKVIPYVDFRLNGPQDGFIGVKHVVVGPTKNPDAIDHAVDHITRDLTIRDSFGVFTPFHPLKP